MNTHRIILILSLIATISISAFSAPPDLIVCHKPYGGGVWTMKPDGSDKKEVSDFGWFGEFNMGGTKIAFSQYYRDGIWVMDADGSNRMELTDFGSSPSWSPDGSKIVFSSGNTNAYSRFIWIMNADGTDLKQLSARVADWADYAHYSNKIVFESFGNGIWIINDDGTGETQIATSGYGPSWSPDDSKIVFQLGKIYVMNPDGSDAHPVSVSNGTLPSMGANGNIAFEATGNSIVVLDTVTKTETAIANGYLAPDWVNRETNPLSGLSFIFAGVGFIPFSEINDGYATTDPGYCLYVVNAPFGSSLNIFGNFAWLRTRGVARYTVQVAKWPTPTTPPVEADYVTLDDSWGNYLWDDGTGKFVYRTIGTDANNRYTVPAATEYWYLHDLMHRWNSTRFSNGKYTMRIRGYNARGGEIAILRRLRVNALTLIIDNTAPVVKLDTLRYSGVPVEACSIVDLAAADNLDFTITAKSNEGHLLRYSLAAYWGENSYFPITGDSYHPAIHGISWTGIDKQTFSHNGWPATCAYQFRVSAVNRTTNGYHRIHYSSYNKHVTLLLH